MPNRIVREGILASPKMARLGWAEEVFFRRLMSVVDDFGRFYADPGLLRAACYPRQLSKVSDPDVVKWTACAQEAGLIRVYPAQDGERYLEVLNFGQQVRAKTSRFPQPLSECAADAQQPLANAHLDVDVSVSVSEGVDVSRKRDPRARKVELPADFAVSDRVKAWAKTKGYDRLSEHLEAFKRKATMNDYRYKNWDDAFMEAVREDWAKLRSARGGNGHQQDSGYTPMPGEL